MSKRAPTVQPLSKGRWRLSRRGWSDVFRFDVSNFEVAPIVEGSAAFLITLLVIPGPGMSQQGEVIKKTRRCGVVAKGNYQEGGMGKVEGGEERGC